MDIISIVIGIGSYNDLGLIRSLGEVGVKSIYLYSQHLVVPIYKSKYVLDHKMLPTQVSSIKAEICHILDSYSPKKLVVFPASDDAVLVMDQIQASLPKNVITSHAHGIINELMDKSLMDRMAKDAGLLTPMTKLVDMSSYNCPIDFPIIIKPVKSIDGNKSDIRVCFDKDSYNCAIDDYKKKGYKSALIQQYLKNDSSREIGITGVSMPNGEIVIHGYIDKIRNRSNINNFGIYNPNDNPDCLKSIASYIKTTGYVGVFDTDFIEFNGKLYFIECNFRNGAYGYCTTRAGVNMPAMFAGIAYTSRKPRRVVFMEERTDLLNMLHKSISVYQWIKDILRTDVFLWNNLRDPRPMLRIPESIKRLFRIKKSIM